MKLQFRVVLLDTLSKPLYYLILLFSLIVFWRGHNAPGGGFIGGLLAAGATLFWASAHGSDAAKQRLPFRSPMRLAALGVSLAAISGLPGLLQGNSFLQHIWWEVPLPNVQLAFSTVQLFDFGVYLCVWGGIGGSTLELMALGDEAYQQQFNHATDLHDATVTAEVPSSRTTEGSI